MIHSLLATLLVSIVGAISPSARPPTHSKTLQPLLPYRIPHIPSLDHTTLSPFPIARDGPTLRRRNSEAKPLGRMYSQSELIEWDKEAKRALNWELQIAYEGQTFFDGWDWFTTIDPSHGLVTYVDNATAFKDGLAFWTSDGIPGIQVDHWSDTSIGANRNSVRITTKSLFEGGLFIIDLALMPWGCGVWPAFWTLGYEGTWPETGEIDIIEGIQSNTNNQMTIHTMPGCSINYSTSNLYSGTLTNQDCDSSTGGSGCSIISASNSSYGMSFNLAGGGVFAMKWDTDGIRMWNWNRAMIPSDIIAETPDPDFWGPPAATWDTSICDLESFFKAQVLVLNINLCGDWINSVWNQYPYCPGTCPEYVSNPLNLNNTVMLINYVKVYQQSDAVVTTQQAKTNSNLTGAGGPIGVTNGVAVRGVWWGIARGKMLGMVAVLLIGLVFAGWM
ncbi:hypothetical protein C366_02524 [Cryptococcus neoformans Tu401-1]|nr:hypothetical protein C365_02668 [Cryptococcus neoformans var. grubii Bt85]OXG19668.1 hypothetical protein C366_02524 [Cryptococcus neoformans var. grubii Tu401-1]OXM79783.1 hypothetical protein C364_02487 [Cryptococcus neoformans var. grubii Bt63]